MNLRYEILRAVPKHPLKVMQELGITYEHATPQTMGDQWWFWNCRGVPETLPVYLTELKGSPHDYIGWGLSKEQADKLSGQR